MKVLFLQSRFADPIRKDGLLHREEELVRALAKGLRACGDEFESIAPPGEPQALGADLLAFVGLKRHKWFDWCRANGQRFMYLDKGYYHREFEERKNIVLWRVCVDTQQPLEYLERARHDPARWLSLGREMAPWRKHRPESAIIIANSTKKYHQFFDLPPPGEWVEQVVGELRRYTRRPIWYRPKPSWRDKRPIAGTKYCSTEPLARLFPGAHAVITHGSYICVDGLLNGVPGLILGDGVTRSISSTSVEEIENLRLASDEEKLQLLANLAWCQYRLEEWADGFAWRSVQKLFMQ